MNKQKNNKINFSLIIIGDFPVGKTSICDRIFNKNFQDSKVPTIGTQFQSKIINIKNKTMNIIVWDTSSILIYKTMIMNIIKKVNGIFLVFDVTNINSFNSLSNWIKNIKTVIDLKSVLLYIIANKIDLEKERVINTEQIKNFCKEENLIFFETSAKLDIGINEAIDTITLKYFNNLMFNFFEKIFDIINKKNKIKYFPNLIKKLKSNDLFIFSPLYLIQKLKSEDNFQKINDFEKKIKEQNLEFFDEVFELFKFYITIYLEKTNNEEMNNLILSEIDNFIELFYYQKKYIIYFIKLFANFINNHINLHKNKLKNNENDENKENNENNEKKDNAIVISGEIENNNAEIKSEKKGPTRLRGRRKDNRQIKENKENKENNENKENIEIKENKENKENNEIKEDKENNENKEKKDSKEDIALNRRNKARNLRKLMMKKEKEKMEKLRFYFYKFHSNGMLYQLKRNAKLTSKNLLVYQDIHHDNNINIDQNKIEEKELTLLDKKLLEKRLEEEKLYKQKIEILKTIFYKLDRQYMLYKRKIFENWNLRAKILCLSKISKNDLKKSQNKKKKKLKKSVRTKKDNQNETEEKKEIEEKNVI